MKIDNYNNKISFLIEQGAYWYDVGRLYLNSEKIIVCDPFVGFRNKDNLKDLAPIVQSPVVSLLRIQTEHWGNRIALSRIKFSDHKVSHWKQAEYLWSQDFFVDSGLACYMDIQTCEHYINYVDKFYSQNPHGNIYDDVFAPLFSQNADIEKGDTEGKWVDFYLPNINPMNVIMFQSGIGDGSYRSYWGKSEDSNIVELITDFQLIN